MCKQTFVLSFCIHVYGIVHIILLYCTHIFEINKLWTGTWFPRTVVITMKVWLIIHVFFVNVPLKSPLGEEWLIFDVFHVIFSTLDEETEENYRSASSRWQIYRIMLYQAHPQSSDIELLTLVAICNNCTCRSVYNYHDTYCIEIQLSLPSHENFK